MKANEAPEKIYIPNKPAVISAAYSSKTAFNDVEYTRTDVFIEKACEYLMDYEFNDSPTIADRRKRVEDFKNYMKGE